MKTSTDHRLIVRRVAKLMNLGGVPTMKIQRRRRGRAHPRQGYFTIPEWAMRKHRAYIIAYIIHEMAHFRVVESWDKGWTLRCHGPQLRRIECEAAEAFGLRLLHHKVYLREIRDLESNRALCGEQGAPIEEPMSDPACYI